MKRNFQFLPQELSEITYQIQAAERAYQSAKDKLDILEDTEKDLLAMLKARFSDASNVEAEMQARTLQEWKDFKQGLYQAKLQTGKLSCDYKHALRVLDCLITGISYNKILLSKNVMDGGK